MNIPIVQVTQRYANYDEYFGSLDSMTANQLRDYIVFMHEKHDNDVLAQFILQQNKYRNPSYFNDLLGTKLIAEGRFSEALPVLKKVPLALCERPWYRANYGSSGL